MNPTSRPALPGPRRRLPAGPLLFTALAAACISGTPTDAGEPPSAWLSVSSGAAHNCGLAADSAAYCWGSNRHKQAGLGNQVDVTITPTRVLASAHYLQISAGLEHTCAVGVSGDAYCWGDDEAGQLGIGVERDDTCALGFSTFPCKATPAAVAGSLLFTAIVTGQWHTCGLTTAGAAYCWGLNSVGQLGTRTPAAGCPSAVYCSRTPAAVGGGLTFAALAAGANHTCGLTDAGAAYCWGDNGYGTLGAETMETCSVPAEAAEPCSFDPLPVSGGLNFASLSAGNAHTCGVTPTGEAYCWGWSEWGQLGSVVSAETCFTGPCIPRPTAVDSLTVPLVSIVSGSRHTCGMAADGSLYCWGYNGDGELGNHSLASSLTPVEVTGGLQFADMSAGLGHSCGVTVGSEMYCWGDNSSGQLGRSDYPMQSIPTLVTGK